ncbi:MAG TPA: hypothetical protein VM077_02020 [Candidatus Limnocylindrales bacterium]|nr:hypothetical protein [Candidatus Limnocylindrales bacterium]
MKRIREYAIVAVKEERSNPYDASEIVEILVIEEKDSAYYLDRYTRDGEFVTDTRYKSIKEAKEQAGYEYPNLLLNWIEMEGIKDDVGEVVTTYNSLKELNISESNNIVRIGKIEVRGFIDFQKCKNCKTLRIYYEKYDRYFCPKCNIWLESKCDDPNCEVCITIPEKPLSGQ